MKRTVRSLLGVLASVAVLVLLAGASSPVPKRQTVAEIVKGSSDAVVQIVVFDSLRKQLGLGSGFIVSADGRIVTNYHVIKGAHFAAVKLTNGASFQVEGVLAVDKEKDLVLLKVPGKNLPFLALAEAPLQIGEHVVAIGSPLGLENTVSDGIVSAVREEGSGTTWVQTTAPVSHGNSGGPLLDSYGKVVGVVTWGVSPGVGQNLNFASPSGAIKALLSSAGNTMPFESLNSGIGGGAAAAQREEHKATSSQKTFWRMADPDGVWWDSLAADTKWTFADGYQTAMNEAYRLSHADCMEKVNALTPGPGFDAALKATAAPCINAEEFLKFDVDRSKLLNGIDDFYKDSRNARIPIDFALQHVKNKLKGKRSAKELEDELTGWRNIMNK